MRQQAPASRQLRNWAEHAYEIGFGVAQGRGEGPKAQSRLHDIDKTQHAVGTADILTSGATFRSHTDVRCMLSVSSKPTS